MLDNVKYLKVSSFLVFYMFELLVSRRGECAVAVSSQKPTCPPWCLAVC